MNLIRSIISVFLLVLLLIALAGWIRVGEQPPAKRYGARAVLGACMVAAVGSSILLWTARRPEVN